MNEGKVWLVGAGPWDAGLFTLKGKEVLEQAQVVVYDRLVGPGVLRLIPMDAKKIDVGKTKGCHPIPQEEINEILYREAAAGNRVVRLKGGDPFLFGRGGEELELLSEQGIPFEVVPGITSAISVPAYNGIPVTHRDFASSLHIITGHTKTRGTADIDYESLVKLKGTLVFLMGISGLASICEGLMEAGMAADTPAALLEKGTSAHQRRVVAALKDLVAEGKSAHIQSPAIIIVGPVCGLADAFHWAEDRPLGRMKIMVTRPQDRSSVLAERLRAFGAEVLEVPAIETVQSTDSSQLKAALQKVEEYSWVAFTSVFGVKTFFNVLFEMNRDIRSLAGLKFAAIGNMTKKAIEEKGILVDLVPEEYYGEALGRALAERMREESENPKENTRLGKILLPRARIGTDTVTKPLDAAGIPYEDIPVYETVEGVEETLIRYDETVDYVAFTSSSSVRGFVNQHQGLDYTRVVAVCIGKETAKEARRYGMKIVVSEEPTIDSMVDTLVARG